MIAEDRINAEVKRLDAILARRGQFYEDEAAEHKAYGNVVRWLAEDKAEAERIELEALAASEADEAERMRNDPNFKTRELFKNVKISVPKKEGR